MDLKKRTRFEDSKVSKDSTPIGQWSSLKRDTQTRERAKSLRRVETFVAVKSLCAVVSHISDAHKPGTIGDENAAERGFVCGRMCGGMNCACPHLVIGAEARRAANTPMKSTSERAMRGKAGAAIVRPRNFSFDMYAFFFEHTDCKKRRYSYYDKFRSGRTVCKKMYLMPSADNCKTIRDDAEDTIVSPLNDNNHLISWAKTCNYFWDKR